MKKVIQSKAKAVSKQRGIITFAVVFAILAASFIATHSAVLLGEAIRSAEAKDCRQ